MRKSGVISDSDTIVSIVCQIDIIVDHDAKASLSRRDMVIYLASEYTYSTSMALSVLVLVLGG